MARKEFKAKTLTIGERLFGKITGKGRALRAWGRKVMLTCWWWKKAQVYSVRESNSNNIYCSLTLAKRLLLINCQNKNVQDTISGYESKQEGIINCFQKIISHSLRF